MNPPAASRAFDRALDLVRFLRAHCEWDARQTPESLLPYLLEEAHEVAEAVALRHDEELSRELGDLLLNVAFQVVLAEERGRFTAEDVVRQLEEKMRRRHPHLYGLGPAQDWEQLKVRERADGGSVLEGVPSGLEPLSRAQRLQDRVAAVGFDWPGPAGALAKVAEELDEVQQAGPGEVESEIGDLLFAVVNAARLLDVHAMTALQKANDRFSRRFRALEALAAARGVTLGAASLDELDALWTEVKLQERETREP